MADKLDIYNCESEQRCCKFIEYYNKSENCIPKHFWMDLSTFWSSFDCIDHDAIQTMMSDMPYFEKCLSKECRQALKALPDDEPIIIYRGQNDEHIGRDRVSGLAWTTNLDVAKKFASSGIRGYTAGAPYVLKATVYKRDIAMAFNDRQEAEVVLFDADYLDVETVNRVI